MFGESGALAIKTVLLHRIHLAYVKQEQLDPGYLMTGAGKGRYRLGDVYSEPTVLKHVGKSAHRAQLFAVIRGLFFKWVNILYELLQGMSKHKF